MLSLEKIFPKHNELLEGKYKPDDYVYILSYEKDLTFN